MAENIPTGITAEHIEKAITDFDSGQPHAFGDSTRYDLLVRGRRYSYLPGKLRACTIAGAADCGLKMTPALTNPTETTCWYTIRKDSSNGRG